MVHRLGKCVKGAVMGLSIVSGRAVVIGKDACCAVITRQSVLRYI